MELESAHHPFTAPHPSDASLLYSDPTKVTNFVPALLALWQLWCGKPGKQQLVLVWKELFHGAYCT